MSLLAFALFAIFEAPLSAAAVAGAAVSIPVIIHLLNRKRFRVVEWAAMRFLLAAQKKNSRRMRLEQFLLLAVRCLIVLLLVLAMSSVTPWAEGVWRWMNPAGGKGILAGSTRTHKILVLDGSFSMGLKIGETTCFERARERALQIVGDGGGGDGFSVVLMASPPRRIVPEPSEDGRKVSAELRAVKMTHGNSDLAATLATVASLIKASPGKFPAKEVYFLTDMQRSGWIAPRPGDLSVALQAFQETKAKAVFVDVGQEGVSNLAVTGLEMADPVATTAAETRILATLFNHGDTRDDVGVRLFVGRAREKANDPPVALREVASTSVRAQRNQLTPVPFGYKFSAPGDYVVQVQVAHDPLELDDTRSAVVRVRNTVPVMLVNGKPAPEAFDRATEWLRVALNPYDEGERIPAGVTARPKVLTQFQFADETLGDLTNFDAVFLCDVPRFSPAEIRRLEAHVRRGGAAIFCLGERVDKGEYNESLYRNGQGLLPARLREIAAVSDGYAYQLTMDPEADRLDPLRLFQDGAARERLLMPQFSKFIETEPTRAVRGITPRRILGFRAEPLPKRGPGASPPKVTSGPAILEWRPPLPTPKDAERETDAGKREAMNQRPPVVSGRGRVVLITAPVNTDWSNWPASPAFPPLMQELLFHAASARLRERALPVGEPIEMYLASAETGVEGVVEVPRDPLDFGNPSETAAAIPKLTSHTLADGSVLRFGDTDISGIYKVRLGRHPREYLFAVNVPAVTDDYQQSESNLARTGKEELEKVYPEWDVQVVTDLKQVQHAQAAVSSSEVVYTPQGTGIARILLLVLLALVLAEVVLAWRFGHYSATASQQEHEKTSKKPGWQQWALWAMPWVLFVGVGLVVFVLVHDAWTGDFLGFLPDALRGWVERSLDIPPPAPGEGSRWRLEYGSYFWDGKADPWLATTLGILAIVGVGLIYRREGKTISSAFRTLLVGLRFGVLLLLLAVFLPQLRLYFERQGWPDVVLIIDDSQSMSTLDAYRDDQIRTAADSLAAKAELSDEEKEDLARALVSRADLTKASRLRLAQTFLTGGGDDWLRNLIEKRKVRLHVYRCSTRAQRIADVTSPEEVKQATKGVASLKAEAANDSSQLGVAIRQVLNDFRGTSLAAVVMMTDGVTTEGEDLAGVSRYAAQMGVPLYFVGIGDAHEVRDLYLHDLQVADSVYVHDRVIFNVQVTAQGFTGLTVPVALYEKGKERPLATKTVTLTENNRTIRVQLVHQPAEVGEKVFIVKVPVQKGEVDKENNTIERPIYVRDSKQIKVLYVEGYRRYEYHYVKTLLERESNRIKGNKSINLKVLLLDADADFASQDRTALSSFPKPLKTTDPHTQDDDLWSYDVVILGDVDPEPRDDNTMTENMKNLAEFVRERGGGLLMIAGERFAPRAYRNSPLKDVLPIDLAGERAEAEADEGIVETYRLELTPIGRMHPIFRFNHEEKANDEIWERLKEFHWFADGYVPKRAAEVLATHPSVKAAGKRSGKHALVLQQFSGAGRCMFFGFNETWRWNWREDQVNFNTFWVQTMRHLARSKVGRIELRLDRQTPYRRGEPIKAIVRFPDDDRPPAENLDVKVVVERRAGQGADKETRTLKLTKVEGSRGTFEADLKQTPEGDYRFWLSEPTAKPRPQAECKVLAPPSEMERLRMNQTEMELAASTSQGKFYTLADADRLLSELPSGHRVTVNSSGPPWLVWNSALLFVLALGLLTTEWLMRKQKNLL